MDSFRSDFLGAMEHLIYMSWHPFIMMAKPAWVHIGKEFKTGEAQKKSGIEIESKGFGGFGTLEAFCYFSVTTACIECVLLWYNRDISYKSSNYLGSANQSDLTLHFLLFSF